MIEGRAPIITPCYKRRYNLIDFGVLEKDST